MAWIESHQSLGTHLKLRRLARELRVHRATAIGHLHFLWWWALDNAPTGDLSALSSAEIAEAADWPGHEDQFAAAMKAHGWLDPDGKIHDWAEYAGRLIERREADRERKRNLRRKDVQRTSSGHPQEVQRTSAGQASDVPGMSCVPNPTQPNRTEERERESVRRCGSKLSWRESGKGVAMTTPEHYLDPPDSCDPAPDPEVKRLKEDVRALRGLLKQCHWHITLAVGSPYTGYLFNHDQLEAVKLLRNKIDAELNG